jgi:hypothetical protein
MEIDLQDKPGAEVVEGLKREPAADAPEQGEGEGEGGTPPGEQEGAGEPPSLGVDPKEFDEAIGKLWVVGWSFAAKQLNEPELKEEKEMVQEAADALGPVARKHVPRQMQKFGPEAVALSWVSGRIFSKMDHL